MSLRYLLDTNILSDLVRKPRGIIAEKISDVGEDAVCTSIIVASELRFGAIKSGSKPLQQQVDLILSVLTILPLKTPADNHYGNIRFRLGVQGTPIGPNDMFIAAHALTAALIVVTANIKEFSRVPDLVIENWLT
ncbi:MAG: type II toxin-antitoxin system VapC family toxin [Burkholderiales bacterium]|nr:type II toxin-antitoxin system VapC family toxin [Burkholderiales bacterium]MDR4517162.1 type II toxin-antitoxin system VapC family toxin [Nitrosomonas sp.]